MCLYLIFSDLSLWVFSKKSIANDIVIENIDKNISKITFEYRNSENEKVLIKKQKSNQLVDDLFCQTNHVIYYSPFNKYNIRFVNQEFDYLSFILFFFGTITFLYCAKSELTLDRKVTRLSHMLKKTYQKEIKGD